MSRNARHHTRSRQPAARVPEPFHHAVAEEGDLPRRLLLVSYHFPPDTGAGALRWQKLAGHLADAGWGLDVVTQDPASTVGADPARLRDLPAGTRVYGIRTPRLVRDVAEDVAWKVYRTIRPRRETEPARGGNGAAAPPTASAAPDPDDARRWSQLLRQPRRTYEAWMAMERESAWAARAARTARAILDPSLHLALVTCGPPHMVHDAGRRLAAGTGIPHVIDMRDPWSLVQRLPDALASPLWYRVAARRERRAVRDAALVVTNTDPAREAMQRLYPEHAARIVTVMNGCDQEEPPPARGSDRFTIAYAGTIYLDRDPRLLFRAAALVADELGLSPDRFGIDLMGHVESYAGLSVDTLAAQEGLDPAFVRTYPRGSRQEAMRFLADAAMLVSLPQDSDMAIPSKIFEYMQFPAWLLVLAEPSSATGRLLAGSTADVVRPGDADGLVHVIRRAYLQFREGHRPAPLAHEPRFSRRTQARVLLDAIESRVLRSPAAAGTPAAPMRSSVPAA